MTVSEYKAEIERLRAEHARLLSSNIRVVAKTAPNKATGVAETWLRVQGIRDTGWGFSAKTQGWKTFFEQIDTIRAQLESQYQ